MDLEVYLQYLTLVLTGMVHFIWDAAALFYYSNFTLLLFASSPWWKHWRMNYIYCIYLFIFAITVPSNSWWKHWWMNGLILLQYSQYLYSIHCMCTHITALSITNYWNPPYTLDCLELMIGWSFSKFFGVWQGFHIITLY